MLSGRHESYCSASRTATDLPVPRSPIMRTPPMEGSMTLSSSASFISFCPASRTNGNAAVRRARLTAGTTSAGACGAVVAAAATATPRWATSCRSEAGDATEAARRMIGSPLLLPWAALPEAEASQQGVAQHRREPGGRRRLVIGHRPQTS